MKKKVFTSYEDSLPYKEVRQDGFTVNFAPRAYLQGGGIYQIKNLVNNHSYVGSTKHFFKRLKSHKNCISCMRNANPKVQAAFIEFGWEKFVFTILEHVDDLSKLIEREQYYTDIIKPEYNVYIIAKSALGVKRSELTREKVRAANLGLKHPEWRNKIKRAAQTGVKRGPLSELAKKHMSEAQLKLYTSGYVNPNKGRKLRQESIEKRVRKCVVPVLQFAMDGKFIKEWPSILSAAKALKVSPSGIGTSIRKTTEGHQKYSVGYIWKRKYDTKTDRD